MNDISAVKVGELSEALENIAKMLENVIEPKGIFLLVMAANRLREQQTELFSCYRKLAEIDGLIYRDMDHGDEIKKDDQSQH
jgi:hypothetical protein